MSNLASLGFSDKTGYLYQKDILSVCSVILGEMFKNKKVFHSNIKNE